MNLGLADDLGSGNPPKKVSDYSPFGAYAGVAKNQGWYQASDKDSNGNIVYKSNYSPAFNDIVNPKNPNEKAHMALIGNGNQKFDVVIRDKNGNILNTMFSGISPQDVQTYLTKQGGLVDERANNVNANTVATSAPVKNYGSTLFNF